MKLVDSWISLSSASTGSRSAEIQLSNPLLLALVPEETGLYNLNIGNATFVDPN
jgi:hypothetical protein